MGRAARHKQTRREAALRTTRLEPAACPACGELLDAATGVAFGARTGPSPKPGNVTICAYCTTALVFTDVMTLRLARPEDLAGLTEETRAWLERAARLMRM